MVGSLPFVTWGYGFDSCWAHLCCFDFWTLGGSELSPGKCARAFFPWDPREEGLRLAQEGSQEVSCARKIIEILMKLKFRLNKLSCKSFKNFETDLLFFLFPYLAQHYCRKPRRWFLCLNTYLLFNSNVFLDFLLKTITLSAIMNSWSWSLNYYTHVCFLL